MTPAARALDPPTVPATHAAVRKAFSFPVAIAALLLVLAVLTTRSRFDDPDMWWHLKLGQVISTTRSIPTTDTFSYTTNHHATIPHEWLAQLSIYAAYRLAGNSGLMLWLCLTTAALLILGYVLCALTSGNAKVSLLGALAIWLFGTVGFAIRPQMIGYLLLIVELLLLHLGRTRSPRWFLALPPLFALWVNCHGSFFLGIGLAGILLFSSWFHFGRGSLVAIPWNPARRRMLALALALSVLALLLNPAGLRQALYPLDTMLHQPINIGNVQEWQPLRLTSARGIALLALTGGIFLSLILRPSVLYFDELLLLTLGVWLAASHERMLFVFGILVAPILTRLLADTWERYDPRQDRPGANAILIALALGVSVLAFPSRASLARQVNENNPVKAVAFLQSHHFPGPILNEWIYGGYLIWAAPQYPDFIDGRADIFEWTGVISQYGRWINLQTPPNALLDKYRVNLCILSRSASMTNVLPLLPNWKTIYADDTTLIFARIPALTPPPHPASGESN